MQGSRHVSSMESVTRLMCLALAAWSSISIRGQWSFHLIIQFCISKPCLLNCNEVAHAPAMACHVCASVLAKSIRLGGYTGKYEQLQTTIVYICAIIYQYVQICNKKYVSVHTTTYTTYMHMLYTSPAPDSSWPDRNNPSQYACKAAGMFRAWRV